MGHPWPLVIGYQGECLRHQGVQSAGTQAAADDQQVQRPGAPGKTGCRISLRRKRWAQGVTHALGIFEHIGKGCKNAVSDCGQHFVDHARDRVLFMQHQRLAQKHAHHARRKSNVAAKTQHHVRLDAPDNAHALPESPEQPQRQKCQRGQTLAAHT